MPVRELVLLAEPAPPEIIAPPQYSVAWVILSVLCLLVITALIVGTLKITRAIEKRIAYRDRPSDVDTVKAEFLRAVNDIADRHDSGDLAAREGHHELTSVMRRFVRRTTGQDVTSQDTSTLRADPRTRDVGELIAALYEPDFAQSTDAELQDSVRRSREVIRRWS